MDAIVFFCGWKEKVRGKGRRKRKRRGERNRRIRRNYQSRTPEKKNHNPASQPYILSKSEFTAPMCEHNQ